MPKKNDDNAAAKPTAEPVKVTVKTAEPATTDAPETTTPIVASRKIITVSHDSDDGETAPAAAPAPAEPATRVIKKSRIEPLSAPEVSDEPASEPAAETKADETSSKTEKSDESAATPTPAKDDTQAEAPEKSDEKPAEETTDTETPPVESGFTLDEGDEGQHPMDEAQSDADKAAAAKQEAIDKLVQDETYFLPINSVEKRRAKHMLWVTLLLFIVLGVAAAAWASSGGYVTIPGL